MLHYDNVKTACIIWIYIICWTSYRSLYKYLRCIYNRRGFNIWLWKMLTIKFNCKLTCCNSNNLNLLSFVSGYKNIWKRSFISIHWSVLSTIYSPLYRFDPCVRNEQSCSTHTWLKKSREIIRDGNPSSNEVTTVSIIQSWTRNSG